MVCFYIVRHGQTLLNSLDRVQGWADSPFTEAGKQMAAGWFIAFGKYYEQPV